MVQFLASDGEFIDGGDFRIQYVRKFKTTTIDVEWRESRPVLYIQKSRIFILYKKNGKAVGDTVLPEGSLKYYLENSKTYLGEKTFRFDIYYKGILQYDRDKKNSDGSLVRQTKVQRCYCFDYQELVKAFGINLEKNKIDDDIIEDSKDISKEDLQGRFDL